MTGPLGENRFQLNEGSQKSNLRQVLGVCILFAVLLFLRAGSNLFFYVFAGVSLVTFAVGTVPLCMYLLLFLLPFSTIIKVNPDDITFYTILFFVTVLKMLLMQKRMQKNTFFVIAAFAIYGLVFSGVSQLTTIITMACGLLMLYFLRNEKVDAKIAITAFALGIVFASVLGLVKENYPLIDALVEGVALKTGEDEYAARFSGLMGNPNYYTMDNIIALSTLVVLMLMRKIPQKYMWYMLLLSAFGIMSVSKSFLIAWTILVIIWLFLSMRQGIDKAVVYTLIIATCLAGVYIFAFDAINLYLFRLGQDVSSEANDVFTGRLGIWESYLKLIFTNPKILLFGNGLSTISNYGKGAHNTYLEALYYLGIVGSGILVVALRQSIGRIIVKPIMWIPVFILLVRMFAIGYLTHDNLWLYLALFVIVAKEINDQENKEAN